MACPRTGRTLIDMLLNTREWGEGDRVAVLVHGMILFV
jgi:hypothetical protein